MGQPGTSLADIQAALIALRATNNGPLNGVVPPKIITGQTYLPTGYALIGNTVTTAVNDRYYHPYYCSETKTFTGMRTYNQGVGDNTETLRLGVYNDDGASGGPGSLLIDAGQITLSAAAALRTLVSSFTLIAGKWYWLCSAHNTAAAIFGMSPIINLTAVGNSQIPMVSSHLGYTLTTAPSTTPLSNVGVGLYVSTAYGALPSTAVAPTGEASNNVYSAVVAGAGALPLVGIYV